jgi:HEPN domain-containing protein
MTEPLRAPVETPAVWRRYAGGDLRAAYLTLQDEIPPYPAVCFLCQGAAELDLAAQHEPSFREFQLEGARLNEYIAAGRYPGGISAEGVGAQEAREAYEAAEKIMARVKALLSTKEIAMQRLYMTCGGKNYRG